MGNLIHEALSEDILGAAMAVLNELKPGLDEKLYGNAWSDESRAARDSSDYPCHPCNPWLENLLERSRA